MYKQHPSDTAFRSIDKDLIMRYRSTYKEALFDGTYNSFLQLQEVFHETTFYWMRGGLAAHSVNGIHHIFPGQKFVMDWRGVPHVEN